MDPWKASGPPGGVVLVAVPRPLQGPLDYVLPADDDTGAGAQEIVGCRVRVPLGRGQAVGVVVGRRDVSGVAPERLRRISRRLDRDPLFPPELLATLEWAARYYQHPLGSVLHAALPSPLRKGRAPLRGERWWVLTRDGSPEEYGLRRAPQQRALYQRLLTGGGAAPSAALITEEPAWQRAARELERHGLLRVEQRPPAGEASDNGPPGAPVELTEAQQQALASYRARGRGFQAFLLEGVTGSGKTEVYAAMARAELDAGRQVLFLVPEIALAPQLIERLQARLGRKAVVLHSDLPDSERTESWLAARDGDAGLIVGTRSAVLTPLRRPGLIVVDEEHDPSYIQQEGFRYSARDLAVVRARTLDVPVVLGSATPSLESLHNVRAERYQALHLPSRAGGAAAPAVELLDIRSRPLQGGLSEPLRAAVARHLERGQQVLLFLNRRGFAPVLICHACGWVAECHRCDARLTMHRGSQRMRCHHCGYSAPIPAGCPECGADDLRPLGPGTERLETALAEAFPDVARVRIDRDTTRRRGALAERLEEAHSGAARILLGTQMLAKGHHLPQVTLVGIVDADQGLFGADFRSAERLAQLIVQVSGRAGRGSQAGEVLLQTRHPEHPLLHTLLEHGYAAFARQHLEERRAAGLPPFGALALLRAEAVTPEAPMRFLERARERLEAVRPSLGGRADEVQGLGPIPAPMERREGRHRAQLLLRAEARGVLQELLRRWAPDLPGLPEARRVRWSLDVDPAELI